MIPPGPRLVSRPCAASPSFPNWRGGYAAAPIFFLA